MGHCDNLVSVHRGHGGVLQGRRDSEVSLNRAVVVVTVAAWQAAAQDMTRAAVEAGTPSPGSALSSETYAMISGRVLSEIDRFSTPNAENTRKLLMGTGFDPRPFWTWTQRGGQGIGMVTIQPHQAEDRMGEWLRLRHDIAHGHENLSHVSVLQAVRLSNTSAPGWSPAIRLVDAEACMAFFRRLCRLTAGGLGSHLGQTPGVWT